jgi:hypothetical protein
MPLGTLFVDDTDLEHFDMTKMETVTEAHDTLQHSIHKLREGDP